MSELGDKRLSADVVLGQIEQVIRRGSPADSPAYTLVLGAGASFGSVPTARQMLGLPTDDGNIHPQAIPLHLYELEMRATPLQSERPKIVQEFWTRFFHANPDLTHIIPGGARPKVELRDGLPTPESIPEAYQAVFSHKRSEGINTSEGARSYLRKITLPQSGSIDLNGTHFFLASLLSLQGRYGEKGAGGAPVYVGPRAFARTLFTTNFDPLLQVSLQLFQLLYYMTDRPEMLSADALQTDNHPATHLFYAHGSVHRPFLANADDEIGHLRERNAQNLASYLGQHGVIVLGYSGWDDCLLRALKQTSSFANNLYWLARGESSLSKEVRQFLCSRPNAYWVEINDGGQWMASLHQRLCPGMPYTELLSNPIPFLRRRLEQVDLGTIKVESAAAVPARSESPENTQIQPDRPAPESLRTQVVDLLQEAEKRFSERSETGSLESRIKTLEHLADLAYGNGEWKTAVEHYTRIIEVPAVSAASTSLALFRRGYCHRQLGDSEKAIADYSAVLSLKDAPVEQVAMALFNRGNAHRRLDDSEKAIADYSAVISLRDAPIEQVAMALFNRGCAHGRLGDSEKAIADYSAVLSLKDAPVDQIAKALVNRGNTHGRLDDSETAIADYSAVLALKDAPVEVIARALLNRGVAYGRRGDFEKEIADYSAVLSLKETPVEQVAMALFNRGYAHGRLGDSAKAIADYSAVLSLKETPVEQVAKALFNRGNAHGRLDASDKAIADYSAVLSLKDAPPDIVETARNALKELEKRGDENPPPAAAPPRPRKPRR